MNAQQYLAEHPDVSITAITTEMLRLQYECDKQRADKAVVDETVELLKQQDACCSDCVDGLFDFLEQPSSTSSTCPDAPIKMASLKEEGTYDTTFVERILGGRKRKTPAYPLANHHKRYLNALTEYAMYKPFMQIKDVLQIPIDELEILGEGYKSMGMKRYKYGKQYISEWLDNEL